MNAFSWVLMSVPVFLLVRGRLATYIGLAARDNAQ